ncbi:TonB-dependent receptor [Herbaspirillum sp. RTI4]|uniref:TonB-dependent receptor n=1 Tax=Herbaspirillum sp. RTI4 TaxID=3048640 RepID=UPI002AB33C4E|nr:TonB-dependent receptor [Herbaspirillum sp. RTI4]MDY7579617.1 TonB-dependent receptor [Herbaspirillum sp. RTI4]MEA9981832.1 TonB-dependent receptor [Herbaspirillum sp. RTI4]
MNRSIYRLGALRPIAAAVLACCSASVFAQAAESTLPAVVVKGSRSVAEENLLPVTTESITAAQAAQVINGMNVEDTIKYAPSVLVRKRFIGDTNAPMATRTTGINASARSLVYADGILLSALINNNNGNGSPQWFMVAPEEIERVDIMYGPFSAMYAGNSYGAVTVIKTRMPTEFEGSVKASVATENFNLYSTSTRLPAGEVNVNLGNRSGDLSWWFSANHLDSFSQPITFGSVTQSTTAASGSSPVINGAIAAQSRTGGAIQLVGAGSATHTLQDIAKIKLAYDFSPLVTGAYTLGFWQNNQVATAQSYLRTASGTPYYGGSSGNVNIGGNSYSASSIGSQFSSNTVQQQHWMQSLSLNAKKQGAWDWEAVATNFFYSQDLTRTSTGLYPAAQLSGTGRISDAGGTGWSTLDMKGTWHEEGLAPSHTVSFGGHLDQYKLVNPTYNTTDWMNGANGSLYSDSRGKTSTEALWAQDAWRWSPSVVATIGGRFEWWRAYDGYNFATASSGTTYAINQPEVTASGFSPKLSLAWQASDLWSVTASFGKALRFPTVGELYQNISTGSTYTQANPYLRPEKVLSGELAFERNTADSKLRISLFEEHVRDALISQTSTITGTTTPTAFTQNVDATRQRGIEIAGQHDDVLVKGLQLSGSVTWVDAVITENSSYVATTPGATSVGKRVPYVPQLRATVVATYRPDDQWAGTLAGRFSRRMYATVDNTDTNTSTYQGFDGYFVIDTRIQYKVDRHWTASVGIDNLTNKQYFLYHAFPQRTLYADLKYTF